MCPLISPWPSSWQADASDMRPLQEEHTLPVHREPRIGCRFHRYEGRVIAVVQSGPQCTQSTPTHTAKLTTGSGVPPL
jgi:hypothetical protein